MQHWIIRISHITILVPFLLFFNLISYLYEIVCSHINLIRSQFDFKCTCTILLLLQFQIPCRIEACAARHTKNKQTYGFFPYICLSLFFNRIQLPHKLKIRVVIHISRDKCSPPLVNKVHYLSAKALLLLSCILGTS